MQLRSDGHNGLSDADLEEMIEEATQDAYGESEQTVGFYTMLEDSLALPFRTEMFGVDVVVERIDINEYEQIVALCSRGGSCHYIPILDLPLPGHPPLTDPTPPLSPPPNLSGGLPSSPPEGAEWIDAFRRWKRGR
jgi:hypothetical protein